jgi:predicted Rossmann fold nucleotide-binding protein DprA/Smf involved in DNA uptake
MSQARKPAMGKTSSHTAKATKKSKKSTAKRTDSRKPSEAANPSGKSSTGASKSEAQADETPRWTFFTNHAHVLICLHQDSEAILREIAQRVGITERAVQRIVQELEQAGFVQRERVGRQNKYTVAKNMFLRHPIEEHCSVDELFAVILNEKD